MSEGSRSDYASGHLLSYSDRSTENQDAHSPKTSKPRSSPDVPSLSRCAACYNSVPRWGGNGESSSSAEDSGPEIDCESEPESSSSSSSSGGSGDALADTPEQPEAERQTPECGQPKSGGQDGDETQETVLSQDEGKRKIRRAPLVKSSSLPASFTPHSTPLSVLPFRPRVVSTLHLQVLPQTQDEETSYTIRECFAENTKREEAEGRGLINHPPPWPPFQWQHLGLPWQQWSQPTLHPSPLYQQPPHRPPYPQEAPPQPFFPAQGQMLMPPPQALPVLHPPTLHTPPTHLHTLTQHPYWYCNRMNFSYPHWNHYSRAQLHKHNRPFNM
ncbi:WW domain-binding protein 11-like [Mugil cephalus]|uniref:WW domain-binding protein 11-like n=1 Tax=Mugil cephalus TaxID=48193 RepID=UPI001FB78BB3|nr:WW domain-binding protein 11-like [Mugil cephalus]